MESAPAGSTNATLTNVRIDNFILHEDKAIALPGSEILVRKNPKSACDALRCLIYADSLVGYNLPSRIKNYFAPFGIKFSITQTSSFRSPEMNAMRCPSG